MKRVYLAGPIQGVLDPITWRKHAASLLPADWEAIDPCNYEAQNPLQLVDVDLNLISRSQAVLAKVRFASWGTAIELRHAWTEDIPVLAFDAPDICSPWLTAHVDRFFPTLERAIEGLKDV